MDTGHCLCPRVIYHTENVTQLLTYTDFPLKSIQVSRFSSNVLLLKETKTCMVHFETDLLENKYLHRSFCIYNLSVRHSCKVVFE
jgi:hypothetical protein